MKSSKLQQEHHIGEPIINKDFGRNIPETQVSGSRKKINMNTSNQTHYLRRPTHLKAFNIKKSTNDPKLDKMLSLVQQVVQSADHMSTYGDEKRSIQQKFSLGLYYNDRQNLQKFLDKVDYAFCSQNAIRLNSAISNHHDLAKNLYEKGSTSHLLNIKSLQQKQINKSGHGFFNFNTLTYCGPFFRQQTSKNLRSHSSNRATEFLQKQQNLQTRNLSIILDDQNKRPHSISYIEKKTNFKKQQIQFEIERVKFQIFELQTVLNQLQNVKYLSIQSVVPLTPAQMNSRVPIRKTVQTEDVVRQNWHIPPSNQKPINLKPELAQLQYTKTLEKNNQISFGPVKIIEKNQLNYNNVTIIHPEAQIIKQQNVRSTKQNIQKHYPSIGDPNFATREQKDSISDKRRVGNTCSIVCGTLSWNSNDDLKSLRILPTSTLHHDPWKQNSLSINNGAVNQQIQIAEQKRNIEPEIRFYPSQSQLKRQNQQQKAKLDKKQLQITNKKDVQEIQQNKQQQKPHESFINVQGRIRYSFENEKNSDKNQCEQKQIQTDLSLLKQDSPFDTNLKMIPSQTTMTNFPNTTNHLPSIISEQNPSIISGDHEGTIPKEKSVEEKDTQTIDEELPTQAKEQEKNQNQVVQKQQAFQELNALVDDLKKQILKLRQKKSNLEQEKDLFKIKFEIYENKHGHLNDTEIDEMKMKLKIKEMERAVRRQQEEKDLLDRLGVQKSLSSKNNSRENSPSKENKLVVQISRRQTPPKKNQTLKIDLQAERDQSLSGTQLHELSPIKEKRRMDKQKKCSNEQHKDSDEDDDIRFQHRSSQGSPTKIIQKQSSKKSKKEEIKTEEQVKSNNLPQNFQYPYGYPQGTYGQQQYSPQGFNPMSYYGPIPPNPNGVVNNIYVNGSGVSQGPSNPLDQKILKKIEGMEQQIVQNNNSIRSLQQKISSKGSKIKPQKSVSFSHIQNKQFADEGHDDRSEQNIKLKDELKEIRKAKEKQNNELNQKIEELKRILKRQREMLNEKNQQLLEIRSKSVDKVPPSITLQVPGANNNNNKPHDHKKCQQAFKLYKDSLVKKDEVNKKLKQRLKQLTDLINKDRETLKNLQRVYKIEAQKNKSLKDELRSKDEELIKFKNGEIRRVVEEQKKAQQKTDIKHPSLEIHHRPDMSVVREEDNQSEDTISKKSQKRSESDNESLGISNKSKKSEEPNIQVHSSSQRGVSSEELMMLQNENQKEIQELKRRINELEIEYRGGSNDKREEASHNSRKQIEESRIEIIPHLETQTKKVPTFVHTHLNYGGGGGPEQSRIVFDDFSDEDAFDPAKLPQFVSRQSEVKVDDNSILGEFYDPSYHDQKKEFEQEMEAAKNRIFSLSTKENDLKALRERIDELEQKQRKLEELERQLREMGHKCDLQDIPKILKDKDSVILTLKHQLPASNVCSSSSFNDEEFNLLKQRLADKENDFLNLNKIMVFSVRLNVDNDSEEYKETLKQKISTVPVEILQDIKNIIMGDKQAVQKVKDEQLENELNVRIQSLQKQLSQSGDQLQAVKQQLKQKFEEHNKELSLKDNEIDSKSKQLSKLNIEISELSSIVQKLRPLPELVSDLELKNNKSLLMVKDKDQQITRLKLSIEPLQHQLEGLKAELGAQIKELKKELKQKDKQLESFTDNQTEHQEEKEQLKSKLKTLENSRNTLQRQLAATKRQNDSLNNKLRQLQTSLKAASTEIEEYVITISTLKQQQKQSESLNDGLDKVVKDQERKVYDLNNQKQKLEERLADLVKKFKEKETQLAKVKKDYDCIDNQLKTMKNQLQEEKKDLIKNLKNTQNKLSQSIDKAQDLQSQNCRLKQKLNKQLPVRKQSERKLRQTEPLLEQLNQNLSLMQEQNKKLSQARDKEIVEKKVVKEVLAQKELVVDGLQAKLKQLEDKNKEIINNAAKEKRNSGDLDRQNKEKEKQISKLQLELSNKDKQLAKTVSLSQSTQDQMTSKINALQQANSQLAEKVQELLKEISTSNEKNEKVHKSLEQKDKLVKQKEDELIQLHKRIIDFEGKLQELLQAREKEQLQKRDYTKRLKLKQTELLNSKKEAMTTQEQVLKQLQAEQSITRSLEKQLKHLELSIKQLTKKLEQQQELYKQLEGLFIKQAEQRSKLLVQFKNTQNQLADKVRQCQSLILELEGLKKKGVMDKELNDKRLNEMKKELDSLNSLKKLKDGDYEKRIKILEDSIRNKENQLRNKQVEFAQLQEQLNRSVQSSHTVTLSLNAQIKELNRKLLQKQKQNLQLCKDIEALKSQSYKSKNAHQNENKLLKDRLQKLQSELISTKQIKNGLDVKLLQKQKNVRELEIKGSDLDKKLNDKTAQLSKMGSTIEAFRLKERDLQAQRAEQSKRIEAYLKKYNQTKQQLQTLYTEYSLKEDEHTRALKEGLKSTSLLNKNITQKQFQIEGLNMEISNISQQLLLLKDQSRKLEQAHKKQETRKKLELQKLKNNYENEIENLKKQKTEEQEKARKLRKRIEDLENQLKKLNMELSEEEQKEDELKKLRNEENSQKKDVEKNLRVKEEQLRRLQDLLEAKEQEMKLFREQQLKERQSLKLMLQQRQQTINELKEILTSKESELLLMKENEQKLKQQQVAKLLGKEEEMFKLKEELKIMELEMAHLDKLAEIEKGEKEKLIKKIKELQNESVRNRKDSLTKENRLADELDKRDKAIRELNNTISLNLLDKKALEQVVARLNLLIEQLRSIIDVRQAEQSKQFQEIHQLQLQIQSLSNQLGLAKAENQNLLEQLSKEKKLTVKLTKEKQTETNKLNVIINRKDTQFMNGNQKLYEDLEKSHLDYINLKNEYTTRTIELNDKTHQLNQDLQNSLKLLSEKQEQLKQSAIQSTKLNNRINQLLKEKSLQQQNHKKSTQDLINKIQSANTLSDDKESEINTLLSEINKLNAKIKSLEDLQSSLQKQESQLNAEIMELQNNLNKSTQDNERVKSQNKLLQDQCNKYRKDLETEVKRVSALSERQSNQKLKEIQRINKNLEEMRQKNIAKQQLISKLTEDISEFNRREKDSQKQKSKQQKQLKNLQHRIKLFEEQIDKLVNMIDDYHLKETDLLSRLSDKDALVLKLQQELKNKDSLLGMNSKQLTTKIDQLSSMIQKQNTQLRQQFKLAKQLEASNRDLICDNAQMREQREQILKKKAAQKKEKNQLLQTVNNLENDIMIKQNAIKKLENELKLLKENIVAQRNESNTKGKQLELQINNLRKQLAKKQNQINKIQLLLKSTQTSLKQQLTSKINQIQTLNAQLLSMRKQRESLFLAKDKELQELKIQVKSLQEEVDSLAKQIELKDEEQSRERQRLMTEKTFAQRKLKEKEIQFDTFSLTLKDLEQQNKLFNSIRQKELAEKRQLTQLTFKKEQELEKIKEEFTRNQAELIKGQDQQKAVKTDLSKRLREKQVEVANLRRNLDRKDVDITRLKEKEETERKQSTNKIAQKDSDLASLREKIQLLEQKDKQSQKCREKEAQQLKTTIYQLNVAVEQQERLRARIKESEQKSMGLLNESKKKQLETKEFEQKLKEKDSEMLLKQKLIMEVNDKIKRAQGKRELLQKEIKEYQTNANELQQKVSAIAKELEQRSVLIEELKQSINNEKSQREQFSLRLKQKEKQLEQQKQSILETQSTKESLFSQVNDLNRQLSLKSRAIEKLQSTQKQLEDQLTKEKESRSKELSQINAKLLSVSRQLSVAKQESLRNVEAVNKDKRQLQTEKLLLLNKLKQKDSLIDKVKTDQQSKQNNFIQKIKKLQNELNGFKSKLAESEAREKQLNKDVEQKVIDTKIYELKLKLAKIDKSSQDQQAQEQQPEYASSSSKQRASSSRKLANTDSPAKNPSSLDNVFVQVFELQEKVKELQRFKEIRNPDDYKKQQDEYNAHKTQLDSQIKKLQTEVSAKQRQSQNQRRDLTRKNSELEKLRESLRVSQRQLSDFKQNWDRSEKEKNQLQSLIEKQEKRLAFLEAREKEYKELKQSTQTKDKQLQDLKMRMDSLLVQLEIIEKERAQSNKTMKAQVDQKDAQLQRNEDEIRKLKAVIEIKEKELLKLFGDLQTNTQNNKDISVLVKMIERHKNELLELYRKVLKKQRDLKAYSETLRLRFNYNNENQEQLASQTDQELRNLEKDIAQKQQSILQLNENTNSFIRNKSPQDGSLNRFNRMVEFHKKEVLHLHTQLRNKYDYFRKANNPVTGFKQNDVEMLKTELQSTKRSLLAQQQTFSKILASSSNANTASNNTTASSTSHKRSTSLTLNNPQLDIFNLHLKMNEKDEEIADLKRLLREHLLISREHISMDMNESQGLLNSVENGINASFVELVEKDFSGHLNNLNNNNDSQSSQEDSQKETMRKSMTNLNLNSITEVEEQQAVQNDKLMNSKKKASITQNNNQQRQNNLINNGNTQTVRPKRSPIMSLESLVPEFFQNRPMRPKSTDTVEAMKRDENSGLDNYKDFRYKGSKSGLLTVESITPQYFGGKKQ